MRRAMRGKWMLWSIVWAATVVWFPAAASADVPYFTYSKDSYNRYVYTQPAYAPSRVAGQEIVVDGKGGRTKSPLKRPQDLYVAPNDDIYIADTDNNRIVHLDAAGSFIRELKVPDSPLKQPQGVFVDPSGDIYVADTGNKRVVRLDKDGRLVRKFARPRTSYISDSFVYEPINMVVDQRGFVYVVSTGSYQGIVEFDPEGQFYGFYGTNATKASLMDVLRRSFYTKEQLSRQVRLLPVTIRNIDMDKQGFIYTVSGSDSEQVKKLNISGDNLWKDKSFGEPLSFQEDPTIKSVLNDITVDAGGNMTVIDKTLNTVSQYTPDGKVLFFWAGPVSTGNPQLGINHSPVAVDSNSAGELLILDDALNLIQVLKPTEFGKAVNEAFLLTQDGKYAESEESWRRVVKLNALYSPAYDGLAHVASYKEDYKEALRLFQLAGNQSGYSDAFWQLRLIWFQNNFGFIGNTFLLLVAAMAVTRKIRASRRRKRHNGISAQASKPSGGRVIAELMQQFRHAFTILKRPLDGFGDLRQLNRGSYLIAFVLLVCVIGMLLVKIYWTGFIFSPIPVNERDGAPLILGFAAVWLSWVVCAYLIGSIRQGEARFKDVFIGSSYALFPVVLMSVPLAVLSNVSTLSEAPIYHFLESAMMIWCGLLFFWMVQSVQNYTVGEAVVHILTTLFAMTMLWVLISILFGLSSEFVDFVYTIYQEVSM